MVVKATVDQGVSTFQTVCTMHEATDAEAEFGCAMPRLETETMNILLWQFN
jgi:hypothetical protein